jgi:xanthine dehydrogenase large subunit
MKAEHREPLVTGTARFTADLPLPAGTLHAMVAVSPHAHAGFTRIECAEALEEPGVECVLTAADIPGLNDIGNVVHDEPLLAVSEVHCVGQPYALVLGVNADAAWRGAQAVAADWNPLPAVFDAREAYRAGGLAADAAHLRDGGCRCRLGTMRHGRQWPCRYRLGGARLHGDPVRAGRATR